MYYVCTRVCICIGACVCGEIDEGEIGARETFSQYIMNTPDPYHQVIVHWIHLVKNHDFLGFWLKLTE